MYTMVVGVAITGFVSCGKTYKSDKALKTGLDTLSYVQGFQVGKSLKDRNGVEEIDVSSFMRGFEDAVKKDTPFMNAQKLQAAEKAFTMRMVSKKTKELQEKTKAFMAENGKKSGVQPLGVGSQMKIVTKGTGAVPGVKDTVVLRFTQRDMKGKENYTNKNSAPLKATVESLGIQSIMSALQMVPAGSKFELYLPVELTPGFNPQTMEEAYGVAIFEMELLEVIPGKPGAADTKTNK